jgi:hypothetical protein
MNTKKKRERLFINEVTTIYPDFPSGTISDSEEPDFLISSESQVIGVEIVDYIRGQNQGESAYRRNEKLWQQIADMARQEFETHHSDPLMIHFFWHPHRHPRKADVKRLAVSAASIIGQCVPQTLFENIRIDFDDIESTPLQEFVVSIYITRVRNNKQVLWSYTNAGLISISVNEIQDLISSKNAKVTNYLQKCDKVWLIIVADGRYISSNVDLSEEVRHNCFHSQFKKVLFYDRLNKRVIPLAIQ